MKEKLKNKKVVYTIIGIISIALVAIAITYAYWLVTKTQQGENLITSACLDVDITEEKNDILLQDRYPMSDEEGMELVPYEFTVTNKCNTSVDYHVNLEATGSADSALAATTIKVMLNDDNPKVLYDYVGTNTTIEGAYKAYTLGYGTLSAKDGEGSSKSYSLRLWIDADAPISEMNKTFTSRISVSVGQGVTASGTELASLILEDAEENSYLYTTTPNFVRTTDDNEYGLYSAQDDYGISYYFRGDVNNNYVKLGKWKESISDGVIGCYAMVDGSCVGNSYDTMEECEADMSNQGYAKCKDLKYTDEGNDMYWRIVRINGDGTVRLIYDGISAAENNTEHTVTIKTASYNTEYNLSKYVGYTYDDGTGKQKDSTVKKIVETWYETNLENDYGRYIADSVFCNDREVSNESEGYQYYTAYNRLYRQPSPSLVCKTESDKYTVSSAKGNGYLTKPVGLITADEVTMAGTNVGSTNYSFYLATNEGHYYWTMSPCYYGHDYAYIWILGGNGMTGERSVYEASSIQSGYLPSVRPVINIKADVLFKGNGTVGSPYEIVMN